MLPEEKLAQIKIDKEDIKDEMTNYIKRPVLIRSASVSAKNKGYNSVYNNFNNFRKPSNGNLGFGSINCKNPGLFVSSNFRTPGTYVYASYNKNNLK